MESFYLGKLPYFKKHKFEYTVETFNGLTCILMESFYLGKLPDILKSKFKYTVEIFGV